MATKRTSTKTTKRKSAQRRNTAAPIEQAPPTVKGMIVTGGLRAALSHNQPGVWATDHRLETEHLTDWAYVGNRAIAMQAMQASVTVFDDGGNAGPARKSERQWHRKHWRGSPAVRVQGKSYWATLKSLYGQEDNRTNPLPHDHPLVQLMRRPNPGQTGATFRYEQVIQLQTTGTCLVWNVPNTFGKTVERHVIPTCVAAPIPPRPDLPRGGYRIDPASARFRNVMDAQGFVEMNSYFNAIGRIVPSEQIQKVIWPHPILKDDGLSPFAAGARLIDTSDQVNTARWAQMVNGFEPSLMVLLPENVNMDDQQLQDALTRMTQQYAGAQNHRKIFATNGKNIVTLNTTPKDMDYGTGFEQSRNAVLALTGVPPVMAGIQEAGAYAAYYASLKQGISLTCQPIFDLLAEADTLWFSSRRPDPMNPSGWIREYPEGTTVEIEAAPIDDDDLLEKQLQNDSAMGIRTVDEARSLRGLPMLGGARGSAFIGAGSARSFDTEGSRSVTGSSPFPSTAVSFSGSSTPPAGEGEETGTSNLATTVNLNVAQITSAVEVLNGVSAGTTPTVVAEELLLALGIQESSVHRMVDAAAKQENPIVEQEPKRFHWNHVKKKGSR